jgi:hypothetical protein
VQCKPGVNRLRRRRHQREKRKLVHDAIVERRRLQNTTKGSFDRRSSSCSDRATLFRMSTVNTFEPSVSSSLRSSFGSRRLVSPWFDAPDHRVAIVLGHVRGREVQSYEGRVRPIQQPSRQAMMSCQRKPIPNRISGGGVRMRIFPKVTKQVASSFATSRSPPVAPSSVADHCSRQASRDTRRGSDAAAVPDPTIPGRVRRGARSTNPP